MVKKTSIWSSLEPFIKTKESLHLSDLSRKLKIPHPTLRNHLNFFEKIGLLKKSFKGRLTLYQLNKTSPLLIDSLTLMEKGILIKKIQKNILLNELINSIHKNLKESNLALIFGSAVENIEKANDIDLIITGRKDIEEKVHLISKKLNIKIHLIQTKTLKDITPSLKEEIRKKHLIIQGTEQIIKWLI